MSINVKKIANYQTFHSPLPAPTTKDIKTKPMLSEFSLQLKQGACVCYRAQ